MHAVRYWRAIHTWSSLVCTAFLLILCTTGLPLIFSEEIGDWLNETPYETLPAGAPAADLDGMVEESLRRYPGQMVTSIFVDDDEPQVLVWVAPSWQLSQETPKNNHFVKFDARTARVLTTSDSPQQRGVLIMQWVRRLHLDLFSELPGRMFLGLMALLFVASIVSGVMLYAPFMKKLDFGTIRSDRSRRLRWLDLHNLLGIISLAWALVVGGSGALNEFSVPLFMLWQKTDVQDVLQPWRSRPTSSGSDLGSVQAAFDKAKQALPDMRVISILYPGAPFGTPYHYMIWAKGDTPLTSRLFSPVLVDARSGELTAVVRMPWYLRALEISRPLHFGDYGGLPLKIIWAVLDAILIVILGTGLYLWFARGKSRAARAEKLAREKSSTHGPPATSGGSNRSSRRL